MRKVWFCSLFLVFSYRWSLLSVATYQITHYSLLNPLSTVQEAVCVCFCWAWLPSLSAVVQLSGHICSPKLFIISTIHTLDLAVILQWTVLSTCRTTLSSSGLHLTSELPVCTCWLVISIFHQFFLRISHCQPTCSPSWSHLSPGSLCLPLLTSGAAMSEPNQALFQKAGTTNSEPNPDLRVDWVWAGKSWDLSSRTADRN